MKTLLLLATLLSSQVFAYDVGSDMDRELTEGKILAAMNANDDLYSVDYDITEGKILATMKIVIDEKRETVLESLLLLDIILNRLVEYDQARAKNVVKEVNAISKQLETLSDDEDDATISGLNEVITKLNALVKNLSDVNIY